MNIIIDGNDGTGKTTIVNLLKENKQYNVKERDILTKLTDIHHDFWPKINTDGYFIFLADPVCCHERIMSRGGEKDYYDSKEALFKYHNRFTRLAIHYGIPYIDTTDVSLDCMKNIADEIILFMNNGFDDTYKYIKKFPNPNLISDEMFDSLPILTEGNSKIIKILNDNFTLINFKPTVHSHKLQRAGVVDGTDKTRRDMTRDLMYVLDHENISHAYIFVGDKYVLCKRLKIPKLDENNNVVEFNDIPPVEVIVKRCCVGTDKYRYFNIDKLISRYGDKIVGNNKEYPGLLVRFDYRNPNHDPISGKPIGDEAMCDDLANLFINVDETKYLAKKTFSVLTKYFEKMNIYFEDVCFMITTDGKMHYYEISQDCGRYKQIDESGMTDLDKDVWRSGGSSELVYEKWNRMAVIVNDYVKNDFLNKLN